MSEYDPELQMRHTVFCEAFEKDPAAHNRHWEALLMLLNVPPIHAIHELLWLDPANVPARQGMQAVSAELLVVPTGQVVHWDVPVTFVTVPAAHAVHVLLWL